MCRVTPMLCRIDRVLLFGINKRHPHGHAFRTILRPDGGLVSGSLRDRPGGEVYPRLPPTTRAGRMSFMPTRFWSWWTAFSPMKRSSWFS